jgi:hypothetical protein
MVDYGSERHEYELDLAVEDIDHTRTQAKNPQTTDVIDKGFFTGSALFFPHHRMAIAGCTHCRPRSRVPSPSPLDRSEPPAHDHPGDCH